MLSKEEFQGMNNINVYAMFNIENLFVFISTFRPAVFKYDNCSKYILAM